MLKSVIKAKLVEVNARALHTNRDPVPEPVLESDDPKKKDKNKDLKNGENLPWTQPLPAPGTPYAPPLLHTDADFSGFLALLLVTPSQINYILSRLLTEKDYAELLRQRAAHDGELVTFRLCDLRAAPGAPYQDVYAHTLTNGGSTWGKGVYTAPPKSEKEGAGADAGAVEDPTGAAADARVVLPADDATKEHESADINVKMADDDVSRGAGKRARSPDE